MPVGRCRCRASADAGAAVSDPTARLLTFPACYDLVKVAQVFVGKKRAI